MIRITLAVGWLVAVCLLAGCGPTAPPASDPTDMDAAPAAGKTNGVASGGIGTNNASAETKSVFDDKLKSARDPFFPGSSRLEPKPVVAAGAPVAPVVVPKPPVELALVLNGIMGSPKQRMAVINGKVFEEGDELVVRTANGQARVRCYEIGSQSVTVTVNGKPEKRKIFLKK